VAVSTSASARESLDKKGMDDSQITGATSSYARKYALNGLFAIDDTKDADSTNTHDKAEKPVKQEVKQETKQEDDDRPRFGDSDYANLQSSVLSGTFEPPATADELIKKMFKKYKVSKAMQEKIRGLYSSK
jgi:transcription termination factor NusB